MMDFDAFRTLLLQRFPDTDEAQLAQFRALERLYTEWNARINVISRQDISALYAHHVLHSLAIAAWLQSQPTQEEAFRRGRILDLGTGGGFPGIPLAILYPDASFLLCDSTGKKVSVAREIAAAVKLGNVETIHARAESMPERFDFVVTRAVATLSDLYPWVKGKYRHGVIALKGGDALSGEIARFQAGHPGKPVGTWPVSSWLDDPYYAEKFVVSL